MLVGAMASGPNDTLPEQIYSPQTTPIISTIRNILFMDLLYIKLLVTDSSA